MNNEPEIKVPNEKLRGAIEHRNWAEVAIADAVSPATTRRIDELAALKDKVMRLREVLVESERFLLYGCVHRQINSYLDGADHVCDSVNLSTPCVVCEKDRPL